MKIKNKNLSAGITLIELVVIVFLIVLFSAIMISSFPKIKRQYALSSATYRLAQNLRKVEGLGASGVGTARADGTLLAVKGYGVYVNTGTGGSTTKYIVYAHLDSDPAATTYNGDFSTKLCSDVTAQDIQNFPNHDCILETVDISQQDDPNLTLAPTSGTVLSINFAPPNPIVSISSNNASDGVILSLVIDGLSRKVLTNTSGLISVQ